MAYDLSLRGLKVTLLERGELTSGTTGRHHGQLHCGAPYAVEDRDIGRECVEESSILWRIASDSIEFNYGLFAALSAEDERYAYTFIPAREDCTIPTRLLTARKTLAMEPYLNPTLRLAVQVPDGSMDALHLAVSIALAAASVLLLLSACSRITVAAPEGFAPLEEGGSFRAISPEGMLYRVRSFQSGKREGRYFEWVLPYGNESYLYLTALLVTDRTITLAEAAAPHTIFSRYRDSLLESLATIRTRR